ncbi:MAG: hypothetical protein EFKGCFLK_01486 [Rhodocyclaceae bacterium]|nr:hypothetical protein [Rhodocyclaceae bacterium]CAG0934660.1 Protein TonB [Rhodocyclaceae bacterium]
MPLRRFLLALAASLALHIALLGLALPQGKVSPRNTALSARLLPPATVRPSEALLKDTLADERRAEAVQHQARPSDTKSRRPGPRTPDEAAQRKLSEVMFYPPEAVSRGLEGEVRVLLTLDAEGGIMDAQVAAGSGHRLLDIAAVQAALAMGSLPGAGVRELILPVVFRLR